MQINPNPTSERGASRDAINRPRETLGDSHLISSDPRSRFGLVCDLLCCRGNRQLGAQISSTHHSLLATFPTEVLIKPVRDDCHVLEQVGPAV